VVQINSKLAEEESYRPSSLPLTCQKSQSKSEPEYCEHLYHWATQTSTACNGKDDGCPPSLP
jgi:hypothetical protein